MVLNCRRDENRTHARIRTHLGNKVVQRAEGAADTIGQLARGGLTSSLLDGGEVLPEDRMIHIATTYTSRQHRIRNKLTTIELDGAL